MLERAFRRLEAKVPKPIRKPWRHGSFVFRYAERTIYQAIIQKLARSITGLRAVELLLTNGLFQEQGVMQRVLDELHEDIQFLSFGVVFNDVTALHNQYLDAFYAEEFSASGDPLASHMSRGMVKRDKIRAYCNRKAGIEEARANTVGRFITKTYSGFVHAASPHIMDMCYGNPPRFDLTGETKRFRPERAEDALNYVLRSLFAMAFAANAFGEDELGEEIRAEARSIEIWMEKHP
jgi:hypothetical protein